MKTNRALPSCLAVAVALLAAGCGKYLPEPRQNPVTSVFEAGQTNVSVVYVERWDTAKKALAANFKIDAASALELAVPRTSAMEQRLLDALSVQLGVGFPEASRTLERQTNLADGTVSGTSTETRSAGDAPEVDAPSEAAGDRNIDNQPRLPENERNAVLQKDDPILQYQVANAIYQFVTLVNRSIENTPHVDAYTPFLVTLQVSSIPYARHQPYDVHVDISFYPKVHDPSDAPAACNAGSARGRSSDFKFSRDGKLYRAPIVVPVLVTDNLEGQIASRSAELIRQIGLAATAVQSGIGASLNLGSYNARAGAVFGTDLTSIFTVGKTTENGLLAVLGAPRNPVSDYAMTRRTHNVSVLLLVPDDIATSSEQWVDTFGGPPGPAEKTQDAAKKSEKKGKTQDSEQASQESKRQDGTQDSNKKSKGEKLKLLRRVQVIFSTSLRRPDKVGDALPTGRKKFGKWLVKQLHERGVMPEKPRFDDGRKMSDVQLVDKLGRYFPTGDYPGFVDCMERIDPRFEFHAALYHTLADAYGSNPLFRSTAIPLPSAPDKPKLEPFQVDTAQTPAAFDDINTDRMTVTLTGVSGRTPGDLTATLTLRREDGTHYPFVASAVKREKAKLVFTFDSAAAWGLTDIHAAAGKLDLRYAPHPDLKGENDKPIETDKPIENDKLIETGKVTISQVVYQAAPKLPDTAKKPDTKPARAVVSATTAGGLEVEITEAEAENQAATAGQTN